MSKIKRSIVRTSDGSKTIRLTDWNEQYHSMHGAVQEAYHVFIEAGLRQFSGRKLQILEIGFGTGLNALITYLEGPVQNLDITYTTLETYPVPEKEWEQLDYGKDLGTPRAINAFELLHRSPWNRIVPIEPGFSLHKRQADVREFAPEHPVFNLIFFDAFGARVQPELWTLDIFKRMYKALTPGGFLVTYSAKGSVRRAMLEAGFETERLPGPPGKREMLRARKPAETD